MLEFGEEQDFKYNVDIKVIGVGGGGTNAVKHMMNSDMKGIDFWVANTDSQSLGTFLEVRSVNGSVVKFCFENKSCISDANESASLCPVTI